MAQTPQAGTTGSDPAADNGRGGFGAPTTLILIALGIIFFVWSRSRRRAMEDRLQTQRRERLAEAERSAYDVANVMRSAPREAAAAAATEGLASAARTVAPPTGADDQDRARTLERAEGAAEAERAAAARAEQTAHEAETRGSSEARRSAAAAAAAAEASADTVDAIGTREPRGSSSRANLVAALGLDDDHRVPFGAVAGDGTATCPPDYPIKGNASSRIYHEPGQSSYGPTIAEFCFASAEAAAAAGFRQSRARGQRGQK